MIRNQKALNKNEYDKIHIGDNINVYAYGIKSNVETISTGKFTDTLKGMTESEKKYEVIRYFLRNNTITSIDIYSDKVSYVDGIGYIKCEYLVIKSISGKTLRIRKKDLNEEILKEIYFKYECDRLDYFTNNEFDGYVIHQGVENSKQKSYYCEYIEDYYHGILPDEFVEKNILFLSFEPTNGKINDVDKKILETIFYSGNIRYLGMFWGSYVYEISVGNNEKKYLKINGNLDYDIFYPMLIKQERRKKEEKVKQIRMEEFI